MFERFADTARKVVVMAQEEARELRHNYIGTEHLYLGILRATGGDTRHPNRIAEGLEQRYQIMLAESGVDSISTADLAGWSRTRIVEQVGVSSIETKGGHIPFTPRAKKVLERALQQALHLGHNVIEVDHIMLGILQEDDGVTSALLRALLRDETIDTYRAEIVAGMGANEGGVTRGGESALVGSGGGSESGKDSKVLDKFGINLTQQAKDGELDVLIGRDKELRRMMEILGRRTKNNPILVGDPGVGKTAVVEGLAVMIAEGRAPKKMANKQIYTLDLGQAVAGARYRGDFEERVKAIIKECKQRPDVILFIDEIHTLVGVGSAEGAVDGASLLKPALSRGDIRVVGATTMAEYTRYFEKDAALDRRFQPVEIGEPTPDETQQILVGVIDAYSEFHHVTYTDEALEQAVTLSERYITKRFLPDKAIDLIDEAGSRLNLDHDEGTDVEQEWGEVTALDIAQVVEDWTGIPVKRAVEGEASRLARMESEMELRVVGQDHAIESLSRAIRRTRAGLKDPKRPSGSFIFLGPSGVGKTETARTLAQFLFDDERALVQIDMSEYMEKHSVSRLIGSPPGYVGYDEGGQLTEAVRRRPFSIILFDEIEKAHPDVFNTLLQILEDGRITDAQGRVVDFKNTIIIMTSNLGTESLKVSTIGFGADDSAVDYVRMQEAMNEALKRHFRPEFLNRIDDIIVYRELSEENMVRIVDLLLARPIVQMAANGYELVVTKEAREYLATVEYDASMGARPLRRTIQRLLEDPLSMRILDEDLGDGVSIIADAPGVDKDGKGTGELRFVVVGPVVAEPVDIGASADEPGNA